MFDNEEDPAQLTTLSAIHLSYEFVPATIAFYTGSPGYTSAFIRFI
jgi:hypothetical protein